MRKYIVPGIILLAMGARIAFIWYTNYTAEDAHITFQFARNLARGEGFALNPGQPIYGTTTPLLTLLLALWLRIYPDIYLGARLMDFVASIAGIAILYLAIPFERAARYTIFLIAISGKLITEEMQGMEMPLLLMFFAASLYAFMKGKPVLMGVMAGLLLWTRIDSVFWVACLFIVYVSMDPRAALKFGAMTVLVYLPWVLFAWWYFGSPIPFTIIAKQVAYGIANPSYSTHVSRIVYYLTLPALVAACAGILAVRGRKYWALPLFFVLEGAQLVFSGATFFNRYFYLLTVTEFVLIGIGIGFMVSRAPKYKAALSALALLGILLFSARQLPVIQHAKELQEYRQAGLTEMGKWLHTNTPENSAVLLEPLGYVGWYADRIMIDEVGLVTPSAVELHRFGIQGPYFFLYYWSDYVIWTCGETQAREEIQKYYQLEITFDKGKPRACYEIWKKVNNG